jgi:4'-phosphopantetheinyl transferase
MVEIFAAPAAKRYERFYFDEIYPHITSQRRGRINSFLFIEDALRSLAGECLARLLLSEILHLNLFDIMIDFDKNGKPFSSASSGLHFNISHSGDWAVCAVSALPVGVDIEMIQPIELSIAKDCFTENEYRTMTSFSKRTEQLDYFYTIWTIKESYIKALGLGFSKSPDSFGVSIKNNKIRLTGNCERGYYFRQFNFDNSYRLCACGLETQFCNKIKIRIPE